MVDQAKRKVLKGVAGMSVGSIAFATSTGALSQLNNVSENQPELLPQSDLAELQVSSRLSVQTNELEVVVTNTGKVPANITDMTPAEINTPRGRFDFNALLENGSIQLDVGKSISVPMQHHKVVLDGSTITNRSVLLSEALQQNVSIITDGDSLAAVEVVNSLAA